MSRPTIRADVLHSLAVGVGLSWSLAFIVIGLRYQLQLYADGAMFSYAVAVQDVWAFHWHNISARLSVYLLCLWPAEAYVGLSGDPHGGIVLYGFLFYAAPLLGLIATFAADWSSGRVLFAWACFSTAVLCPLVFGFPTETWLAHAFFWPALAVSHYAGRNFRGTALVFAFFFALSFTHLGALALALAIVATLVPRGLRDPIFLRAAGAFAACLIARVTTRLILFPPGAYFAAVWLRAARQFFDVAILHVDLVLLLIMTLVAYGLLCVVLLRFSPRHAPAFAAAIAAVALAGYWLGFDHALHGSNRYYLRTAIVIFTPIFGVLASLYALPLNNLLVASTPKLAWIATAGGRGTVTRIIASGLILVTLVHAVETGKFVTQWTAYKAAVAALAHGSVSDPELGDPRFVSSERVGARLNRLSWFSTTPYLSAVLANFAPARLVVDPKGNYFWLSCETATANANAARAVPAETRALIRLYSCQHR